MWLDLLFFVIALLLHHAGVFWKKRLMTAFW